MKSVTGSYIFRYFVTLAAGTIDLPNTGGGILGDEEEMAPEEV